MKKMFSFKFLAVLLGMFLVFGATASDVFAQKKRPIIRKKTTVKKTTVVKKPTVPLYTVSSGERIRVLSADIIRHPREGEILASDEIGDAATLGSRVRWNGEPGTVIDDHLLIACGNDAIRPTRVQRAGRGAMSTGEFLRGCPIPVGTRL